MEKLNIAELLKDCPKGMKLYSTVHGEVELKGVYKDMIRCKLNYLNDVIDFYFDGRWVENQGECILFPSKAHRDWNTFQRPFKDGDVCTTIMGTFFIYKKITTYNYCASYVSFFKGVLYPHYNSYPEDCCRHATSEEKQKFFDAIKANGYKWNAETKTLDPEFKDGDILVGKSNQPFIYKKLNNKNSCFSYCGIDRGGRFRLASNDWTFATSLRFATEEEKQKLFDVIKANGYKWNPETKTLEKLSEFQAGDVLVSRAGNIVLCSNIDDNQVIHYHCILSPPNSFMIKNDIGVGRASNCTLATNAEKQKLFDKLKSEGYKYNPETNKLEKLIEPKFKVGDKITNGKVSITIDYIDDDYYYEVGRNIANRLFIKNQDDWELVVIPKFKVGDRIKHRLTGDVYTISSVLSDGCSGGVYNVNVTNELGKSIDIEYQDNYELVPNKFDITTLKPFDKVLVRYNSLEKWHIQFFETYNTKSSVKYPFICLCHSKYGQCIPYEGNEHLWDTINDCDDYFKTWK